MSEDINSYEVTAGEPNPEGEATPNSDATHAVDALLGDGSVVGTMTDDQHAHGEMHESVGHADHHEKPGMPQLDVSTFSSQIFWLIITFALLYVLISRSALPRIHEVVDKRRHRKERDLDRAEALSAEAKKAQQTYEALASKSKAEAKTLLEASAQEVRERQEQALAKADAQAIDLMQQAEAQINQRREELHAELAEVSEAVATSLIAVLSGEEPDAAKIKKEMQAISGASS